MRRLFGSLSVQTAILTMVCLIITYWATEGNAVLAQWVGAVFAALIVGRKVRSNIQANKNVYFDEKEQKLKNINEK